MLLRVAKNSRRSGKEVGEGSADQTDGNNDKRRKAILGLRTDGSTKEIVLAVADAMIAGINSDSDNELSNVLLFAPKSRIELWRKLDILPGGPLQEVMDTVSSTMTNIDGDYVSLAKKALRLGISCIYGSQIPLEMGQDILFGTPKRELQEEKRKILKPIREEAERSDRFLG